MSSHSIAPLNPQSLPLINVRDDFILTDHMGSPLSRSEAISLALHILSAYSDITPGQLDQIQQEFLSKWGMGDQPERSDLA